MAESQMSGTDARVELYEVMAGDEPFLEKAERALELGEAYLGVDNAHLTRIDAVTDYWETVASTDDAGGDFPPGLVLDLGTTYCRRVLERRGTVALSDAPEQGWADDPAYEAHGLHCYHGSPIMLDGEVYGTVCFVSEQPREPFDERETLFAELIARMLEHELERERTAAETTRRANSITVLSRVLRHNLRNEMTLVRGHIARLAERLEEDPYALDALYDNIDRIIDLSDKARKLETVVSTQFESEPVVLGPMLDRISTDVGLNHPGGDVELSGDTDVAVQAMPSLELALAELVENAVKHAGDEPTVRVDVTATEESVRIRVLDNGPGLPQQEQAVLREGVETPLVHGSGLGLWMVYWIVTSHDGSVDADVTEDGTAVTVSIPRVGHEDVPDAVDDVRTLQRGVDRFEAIFEESFDAMVIVNDDRQIIDANERASELFGLSPSDLLGRRMQSFAGAGFDTDNVWREIQATGSHEGRFPLVTADGEERVVEFTATADIVPGQHLLVGRDVTERERRERELAETTRQLQTLLGAVEAAIFVKDAEGRYQLMNHKCRQLLGIEPGEDVAGMTDEDIFPEAVAEQIREQDREVLDGGEPVEFEEELPTGDEDRTYLTRKAPMYDEAGTLTGLCAVSTDITEHIRQEARLQETSRRLEAVLEACPDPLIALDGDGTITLWNEAAEDVFGHRADEVVGEPISDLDLHSGDQGAAFAERFERALDGETFRDLRVERRRKDGETVTLSISTSPLRADDDTVGGIVAVAKAVPDESST